MAKLRTPTRILEIKGSFKKHPERRRDSEPIPNGPIGSAPAYFSEDQAGIWAELVGIIPEGVCGDSDRFCLEITAVLMDEFRKNPLEIKANKITQLMTNLGKMGLSPSDRSKVTAIPENKEASQWDKFGK